MATTKQAAPGYVYLVTKPRVITQPVKFCSTEQDIAVVMAYNQEVEDVLRSVEPNLVAVKQRYYKTHKDSPNRLKAIEACGIQLTVAPYLDLDLACQILRSKDAVAQFEACIDSLCCISITSQTFVDAVLDSPDPCAIVKMVTNAYPRRKEKNFEQMIKDTIMKRENTLQALKSML